MRVVLALLSVLVVGAMGRRILRRLAVTSGREPVLVIGGTGLMGVPTARALASSGRRVVVMSRGQPKGQGTLGRRPAPPEGCELLLCDRDDEAALHAALTSPTCPRIVVDFTAMAPKHVEAIVAAHGERALKHYVFVSTNMVYPGGVAAMDLSERTAAQAAPIAEAEARRDLANTSPDGYGGLKLQCEAVLEATRTLPSTVIRPPAVVGPGCDNRHERLQRLVSDLPPLPPPHRPRRAAAKAGERFRVACARDVASVIAAVADRVPAVPGEAFNVASGSAEGVTLDEYATAMKAAAAGAGLAVSSTAAVVVPNEAVVRNYEKQGVLDTGKAERELGFVPTELHAFLAETVVWHAPLLSEGA
jgi:nucleoside-diphosphate-sugar epimerase